MSDSRPKQKRIKDFDELTITDDFIVNDTEIAAFSLRKAHIRKALLD